MECKIMIVGVGGQGTLLASRILGEFAIANGLDCKLSEVHGMSQRGGSVVTYVKMGERVYSPTLTEGTADVVLAFEQLEGARWSNYVKPDGAIVANVQKIMPMPVLFGAAEYPVDLIERMHKYTPNVNLIDAQALAKEAGNIKAVNVVMIGYLTKLLNLDCEKMLAALRASVPEKFLTLNERAFSLGYNAEIKGEH